MQEQQNGYVNGAGQSHATTATPLAGNAAEPTTLVTPEIRRRLEEPFDESAVKWVVKATSKQNTRQGPVDRGYVLPYVDVRPYADRLNEVAGIGRWTRKYSVQVVEGTGRKIRAGQEWKIVDTAKIVVTCEVTLNGLGSQTGLGEEWADDDNAATAAEAQAFKRACSMFGVGRYLYDLDGEWVDLDQNKRPVWQPPLPDWAKPEHQQGGRNANGSRPPAGARTNSVRTGNNLYRQELVGEVEKLCAVVGAGLAASILQHTAGVTVPGKIRDLTKVPKLIERLQNAARGVARLSELAAKSGAEVYAAASGQLGVDPDLDAIPDTQTLRRLIGMLENHASPGQTPAAMEPPLAPIPQLRRCLLQEARHAAAVTGESLADLIGKSSSGSLSLQTLYKTGERDRPGMDQAIANLRALAQSGRS